MSTEFTPPTGQRVGLYVFTLDTYTMCIHTHTHTHTEEELAEEKQKLYKSIGYSENAAVASYSDEVSTVACVHGVLQTNQIQISFTYTSTLRTKCSLSSRKYL